MGAGGEQWWLVGKTLAAPRLRRTSTRWSSGGRRLETSLFQQPKQRSKEPMALEISIPFLLGPLWGLWRRWFYMFSFVHILLCVLQSSTKCFDLYCVCVSVNKEFIHTATMREEETFPHPPGSFGWSKQSNRQISKRKWPNLITYTCMGTAHTWEGQRLYRHEGFRDRKGKWGPKDTLNGGCSEGFGASEGNCGEGTFSGL